MSLSKVGPFLMQLDHSTILDYSERNGWSGILVAMDFKKAFDSLDFDFRALHKFNIAPPLPL